MMLVKCTQESEAGKPPDPRLMAAIAKSADEAVKAGQLIDSGGLLPTSNATRIRVGGGKLSVTDGPFAEAKELVGGYAIFQLGSREEAIRMGTAFMQMHADILGSGYEGELEIRPMMEPGAPPGAHDAR